MKERFQGKFKTETEIEIKTEKRLKQTREIEEKLKKRKETKVGIIVIDII